MNWIARQCRPDISYRVSRLRSRVNIGTIADLKEANKVLAYAIATADQGLTFKSGVLDWNNLVSAVVTDASHANEVEELKDGRVEAHRSQGARLQLLATPSIIDGTECNFHLIGHASTTIKRVCRATLQAEAYGLTSGVEEGDRLRAAIAEMKGKLPKILGNDWEAAAAAEIPQVWLTDCASLEQSLNKRVMSKVADKRLSIEIAALRQPLWRAVGKAHGDPNYDDYKPEETTDKVRWIDTDVMLADPLTKGMDPDKLRVALKENHWDLTAPVESVIKKRAKQLQRSKSTEAKQDPPPELKKLVEESKAWSEYDADYLGIKWTQATGTRIGIQFDPEEYDNKPEGNMSRELMKGRMYSRDVWIFRNENWLQVEKETDWRSCKHTLHPLANVSIVLIKYSVRSPDKGEAKDEEES